MSSLKLTADSGGGTIEIKGPPTTTSNAAKIITLSRNPGMIIQVVQATKTDTQSTTAEFGSWVDITGLSVDITPASTSNKILISYNLMCASGNVNIGIKLLRDSTAIGEGAGTPATSHYKASNYTWSGGSQLGPISKFVLDSPSTTSEITYKLQFAGNNGNSVGINHFPGNTNYLTSSTITAMEVSG